MTKEEILSKYEPVREEPGWYYINRHHNSMAPEATLLKAWKYEGEESENAVDRGSDTSGR